MDTCVKMYTQQSTGVGAEYARFEGPPRCGMFNGANHNLQVRQLSFVVASFSLFFLLFSLLFLLSFLLLPFFLFFLSFVSFLLCLFSLFSLHLLSPLVRHIRTGRPPLTRHPCSSSGRRRSSR